MTIKDIARMANVSPTTVSKIINGKYDDIGGDTRDRVLKIVKEYNYTPYGTARQANAGKSFVLGLMLRAGELHADFTDAFLQQARAEGYGAIVCTSANAAEERKNIALLLAHKVDAVAWQQVHPNRPDMEKSFGGNGIPFYTINRRLPPTKKNKNLDFTKAGYLAAKTLAAAGHQKIACIVYGESKTETDFINGYKQCLYQHDVPQSCVNVLHWPTDQDSLNSLLCTYTAVICYDYPLASAYRALAGQKGYQTPEDYSLVCLAHTQEQDTGRISALALPYGPLARHCCKSLCALLEGRRAESFAEGPKPNGTATIEAPPEMREKPIVVVGAVGMDIYLNIVGHGKGRNIATSQLTSPGGRGLNQAIGVAKLGMKARLISMRGNDVQGNMLMDALLEHNVDASAVGRHPTLSTSQAYVHYNDNGAEHATITVHEGANGGLTPEHIEASRQAFKNASFCLLQTEVGLEAIARAAQIAKQEGCRVLLKPSASVPITHISDAILQNVDIFMPNLVELRYLLPGDLPLEEKAQHFLDHGAGAVVVTLSHKGCYYRDAEESCYYPAAEFEKVDNTGAADAFAAALAASLARGKQMPEALQYANYAAGLSITRVGAVPVMRLGDAPVPPTAVK